MNDSPGCELIEGWVDEYGDSCSWVCDGWFDTILGAHGVGSHFFLVSTNLFPVAEKSMK